MPRQNFLSKESFVDANEQQCRDSLLSVPAFAPSISLVSENKVLQSYRFTYQQPARDVHYFVDVSILPLNEQYIRISLHGTHSNGEAFNSDSDLSVALHDFESAIMAALKGDTSLYQPLELKPRSGKKLAQFTMAFVTSIGVFFLKKKLS
jgi:hypothetical protein